MKRIFYSVILSLLWGSSDAQTYWKVTSERGEQLLLTINTHDSKNEFEAYTRKDALKDIAGTLNYMLAVTAGKIKYPEIIFIKGTTSRIADSLILTGKFYYIDKTFDFRASVFGNHISGRFIDNRNKLNKITGVRLPDNRPVNDYQSVINTANSLTYRYIGNPDWLKSDEWLKFSERISELKTKISDDYEIGAAYFWLGKNLPFLPYELNRENPYRKPAAAVRKITIREPAPGTALIDAGMLPMNSREMDTLARIIEKKGISKLIVDLRGRTRIHPESAELLASYFTQKPFTGGIYPTKKYFDSRKTLPGAQELSKSFKSFSEAPYKAGDFRSETGRYFRIVPATKTFKGKVFILTDSRTSGPSSSLVYMVRYHKIGTVAGQKASISAGITEKIPVTPDFSLTLVVSDFFTPYNRNLTESDLEPDLVLHHDVDALRHVLKIQ